MKRLISLIKDPKKLLNAIIHRGYLRFIPDKLYLRLSYYFKIKQRLNLKEPVSYNEKLQWLKLYDRNPEYTRLVDKYQVREYIRSKIGANYLIPLLGVYDSFDEIDFEKLPNEFVLKCTHDSGGIVICKNKKDLNISEARRKINRALKRNYYYVHREWPYKNLKPRIICEKLMVDESGTELKDYKIFCFNGTPKLIQVDYDRFINHKRNYYDTHWRYIPVSVQYPTDSNTTINKPDTLKKMLKLSKELSEGYPHVRVDFYSIKDKIYFGEITFYHEAGFGKFDPNEYNDKLGSWIVLPPKKSYV